MEEKIKHIEEEALKDIGQAKDSGELEGVRIKYLGRKGLIAEVLSNLGGLSAEERPKVGKMLSWL